MAEDLSSYIEEQGIKVRYIHSSIDTVERFEILNALRRDDSDVVVGINERRSRLTWGYWLHTDADKEGFYAQVITYPDHWACG